MKLLKEGKDTKEIAKIRGLAISTIEGHLAEKIASGEIQPEELLSAEKISLISTIVRADEEATLRELKESLGEGIEYAEIRYVKKHLAYMKELTKQ